MSVGSVAGPLIGAAAGLFGSKQQADAIESAAEKSGIPILWPSAYPYAQNIMEDAEGLYENQIFAPPAIPPELLGRANQLGYAEQTLPGLVGSAQESWLTGLLPGLNPYVGGMIEAAQRDLQRQYQEQVMPAIGDRAQRAGGYGGSRQGVAEGIASRGLLDATADVTQNILGDAYRQAQAQQRAAWGVSPMMTNLGFVPSLTQQAVGEQYRQDIQQPAMNLAGYQQAMAPYMAWNKAGTQYGTPPNMIGGALRGAQAGALFSDWLNQPPAPQQTTLLAPNMAMGGSGGFGIPGYYS